MEKQKRNFCFVDDLADACEYFLKKVKHKIINIGSGQEKTILGYSKFIMKKMNVNFKILFDKNKPNGTPRKILNFNLARKYGWKPKFSLSEGFDLTFSNFINKKKSNEK